MAAKEPTVRNLADRYQLAPLDWAHGRCGCHHEPLRLASVAPSNKGMNEMPRFMDFHEDLKLPANALEELTQDTKEGKTDEFGVRQVELYHNSDGKVYCLLEAPDAEAVRHHHEALGISCGDVHEVSGLL